MTHPTGPAGTGSSGASGTSPKGVELVHIPFRDGEVLVAEVNGKPHIVLRPALEGMGLDYSAQWRKVRSRSWISVVPLTTQMPGDDQRREVVTIPIRSFLMLLATINEHHVSDEIRPTLIAYQNEVADVIERYFTKARGGPDDFVPFTWTLDEACAIIRQRYHLDHHVQSLTALFRTSGVYKQNGTPTAAFAWAFHFTGTAWTIHPFGMAKIGKRITRVTQQLQESYGMQLRFEIEDAERPAISDVSAREGAS